MRGIKLTKKDGTTKNGMLWRAGQTNEATGDGVELCTPGVLHFYDSLPLSLFMNPVHANYNPHRVFEVEGEYVATDGLKSGAKKLSVIREITDWTEPTTIQKVAFGILCAKEVCEEKGWNTWADKWLSGEDRSRATAEAAREAAWVRSSPEAWAWAAEWEAAGAWAEAAEWEAAREAAKAAKAGWAQAAAWAAERAAQAAWAARAKIDFVALAAAAMGVR